jgi:two-component system cell cycle response regulator
LKEVSRRLKSDLRPYDVVGRYGGEEFLIILPGCELTVGARRADEIRNLVAKDPICTPLGTTSATVSMGVTVTSQGRDYSVSDLLHEADVSMYAAKKKRKEPRRTLFRHSPAGGCGLKASRTGNSQYQPAS